MYEMMTGRPPYDGESPVAVAIKHINGGAPLPSTLNPNIPGGLEQIIMKAMAHELGKRYSSAICSAMVLLPTIVILPIAATIFSQTESRFRPASGTVTSSVGCHSEVMRRVQ